MVHSYLTLPAKRKLFNAGNHDFVLDPEFMEKHEVVKHGHEPKGRLYHNGEQKNWLLPPLRDSKAKVEHEMVETRSVFTSPRALAAGVQYLEEGMHHVKVENAHGKHLNSRVRVLPRPLAAS